ncbi:YybH family protein [Nocardia carnea]|uniref:YybH family protein n=1 Tax=Nocardia carnea TaxID=37328 RepID=UPI002455132D|nr:nuclear transport factor 2 family protein [Nocardia carnea]
MDPSTSAVIATAVRAVLGTHTRAQDAGDTDGVIATYAPDAVLEVPGMDTIVGHDALRAAFQSWAPTVPQRHMVANTLVTADREDTAVALSDVAFFQRGESGWAPQIVGRYEDTLRKLDGTWVIQQRKTIYS